MERSLHPRDCPPSRGQNWLGLLPSWSIAGRGIASSLCSCWNQKLSIILYVCLCLRVCLLLGRSAFVYEMLEILARRCKFNHDAPGLLRQ